MLLLASLLCLGASLPLDPPGNLDEIAPHPIQQDQILKPACVGTGSDPSDGDELTKTRSREFSPLLCHDRPALKAPGTDRLESLPLLFALHSVFRI